MARRELTDNDARGLFDTEARGGRDEQEYNERYGYPTTYRLPKSVADAIRDIANQENVGISELAEWILARFVRRYEAGEIELPKTQREVQYTLDDTM